MPRERVKQCPDAMSSSEFDSKVNAMARLFLTLGLVCLGNVVTASTLLVIPAPRGVGFPADRHSIEPGLVVTPMAIELGRRSQFSIIPAEVSLLNRSARKVVIDRVSPSCGCTVVEFRAGEIAPGASRSIKASINMGNSEGSFAKRLEVAWHFSTEPDRVFFAKIPIRAVVEPIVSISPSQVRFPRGRSATETVRVPLSASGDSYPVLSEVVCPAGCFSANASGSDDPPGVASICIRYDAAAQMTRAGNSRLTLRFRHPNGMPLTRVIDLMF